MRRSYVANTGFGYGDTDTIDLSERLYGHFASDLNSGGTVGEQWVRALHQYYSEPANYDVIDEKVMIEANMYGLPFYTFSGTPQNPPPAVTPPSHSVVGGRRHGASAGRDRLQHRPERPGPPAPVRRPEPTGRVDLHAAAARPGRWERCPSSTAPSSPRSPAT